MSGDEAASDLASRFRRLIQRHGPMPVSRYMGESNALYYDSRDPLGQAGDFTTAPEISQMFGELAGLCLAQCWLDRGAPAPFHLVELGPGRGTLMSDVLRAGARVPGFVEAADLHLVELSPVLRAEQARRLAPYRPRWHDGLAHLPEAPLFLLANEFFDALPIRQFVRDGAGWRERVVGADGEGLAFGLTDAAPIAALTHRLDDTSDGDLVEVCPAAPAIMGRYLFKTTRQLKYAARTIGADTVGTLFTGLAAREPSPELSVRTKEKARALASRLVQ